MQNTSAIKEAVNESENANGLGQSTKKLTTNPRCDESDEFVTRGYHRGFLDDQSVLHACLEFTTEGTGRGGG